MRIAHVSPLHFGTSGYLGGGERYVTNIAFGQLAADHNVSVDILSMSDRTYERAISPRLALRLFEVTSYHDDPLQNIAAELTPALADYDVIHVHQAYTRASQLAIVAARVLGKALALTDHGALLEDGISVERATGYLGCVDLIMAQSRFAAALIPAGYRTGVVPGGVNDRLFCPPTARRRRSHVLFVGRLLPHKGVHCLIRALPRGIELLVAGRKYDDGYAEYLLELGREKSVRFLGAVDDVMLRELYRTAWAAILPSVHCDDWGNVYVAPELMGLTALESMACGTPAIVSSAGALPEFVEHERTGMVFADEMELRNIIERVVTGALDVERLGEAARRRVEDAYGLLPVGHAMLGAYRAIIN